MKTRPENITIAQFIEQHGITMTAIQSNRNPNMDTETKMDHWLCTLSKDGQHMAVHFSTGIGLRKDPLPDAVASLERWAAQTYGPNYKATQNPRLIQQGYRYYTQGRKIPVSPDAASVLDCMASDASGIENARGNFEEWCAEYGYDTDSRKAEKTFRICERQAEELKRFLGSEAFGQLLWNTERE